jgi:hypothetical protein
MAEPTETTPTPPATNGAADWRPLAESLKSDPDIGSSLDRISEKTVPDLVKSYVHLSRKLGSQSSIPDPAKAQPGEIKAFKDSVYKAGIFSPPVGDDWSYTKPDAIPQHFWSDEDATDFAAMVKKHGISEAAAKDLVGIHNRGFERVTQQLDAYAEGSKGKIIEQWKKDGYEFDQVMELALKGAESALTPEEQDALHLPLTSKDGKPFRPIDSPGVVSALAKIGQAFMESNGLTGPMSESNRSAADEANDITRNKTNPKFDLYWKGDQHTVDYVNSLWAKAYPGKVNG